MTGAATAAHRWAPGSAASASSAGRPWTGCAASYHRPAQPRVRRRHDDDATLHRPLGPLGHDVHHKRVDVRRLPPFFGG